MRNLIFFILILNAFSCSAEKQLSTEADIKNRINQLSWESFKVSKSRVNLIIEIDDPTAKQLIQIGESATPYLIDAIIDHDRGVIIHLILTKIWEPENFKFSPVFESKIYYDENKFPYLVNNLKWVIDLDTGEQFVDKDDLLKIKEYWSDKLQ